MKYIFIFLATIFYSTASFSQDPFVTIHLKLRENNKMVTSQNATDFKVLIGRFSIGSAFIDSSYDYIGFCSYADEVIEIIIVNKADTMQLRFKAGLKANQHRPLWSSKFNLDVPFIKGYFEIPSLLLRKDNTFYIRDDFRWEPTSFARRKLPVVSSEWAAVDRPNQ